MDSGVQLSPGLTGKLQSALNYLRDYRMRSESGEEDEEYDNGEKKGTGGRRGDHSEKLRRLERKQKRKQGFNRKNSSLSV